MHCFVALKYMLEESCCCMFEGIKTQFTNYLAIILFRFGHVYGYSKAQTTTPSQKSDAKKFSAFLNWPFSRRFRRFILTAQTP